jgi:hypothetical protein
MTDNSYPASDETAWLRSEDAPRESVRPGNAPAFDQEVIEPRQTAEEGGSGAAPTGRALIGRIRVQSSTVAEVMEEVPGRTSRFRIRRDCDATFDIGIETVG